MCFARRFRREIWQSPAGAFAARSVTRLMPNQLWRAESVKVEGKMADYTSLADSGNTMHRQFCPKCGTPVFTQSEARRQVIGIRAGTLDDAEVGKPGKTIWTSSAPSWATFDPHIPRDERQPPPIA